MIYHLLLDLLVAVHLAYVLYVILGQLAIWIGIPLGWQWIRNPWFRCSHLIMILIVALEATFDMTCPLTTWENSLQKLAGVKTDERSFIGRCLNDVLFLQCPADDEPIFFYSYVGFGLLVLITFVLWPPRPFKKAKISPTLTPPNP